MSTDQIASIDNWGKANDVTRSEAIRRLVEIGLGNRFRHLWSPVSCRRQSKAPRAAELAGKGQAARSMRV
jgi:hypothetical protein